MKKTVFHVSRATKTGKTVNVGDFDTLAEARAAMLAHFNATPKRGKFWYSISEDTLKEIGGVLFRETCFCFGDNGPYRKTFLPDELKNLAESEAFK